MLVKWSHTAAKRKADQEKAAITIPPPSRDEIRRMCDADPDGTGPTHPYYTACDEIEDRHQTHALWLAVVRAEEALILWGRENARRGLGERYSQIAVAFEKGPHLVGKPRQTLLDICVRMQVA